MKPKIDEIIRNPFRLKFINKNVYAVAKSDNPRNAYDSFCGQKRQHFSINVNLIELEILVDVTIFGPSALKNVYNIYYKTVIAPRFITRSWWVKQVMVEICGLIHIFCMILRCNKSFMGSDFYFC